MSLPNSDNILENEEDYLEDEESSDEESSDEEILEKNSEILENGKKKRGRKPKPKDQNEILVKEPKKRGRKPKEKNENEILVKEPKKRGRKPKEKIYSVKELPKTFFEENKNETLILHLPIKSSEINSDNNEPQPDINKGMEYSIYSDDCLNYKINDINLLPTQSNLLNE